MNILMSLFLTILSSLPVIINAIPRQNSPGRPLSSFPECGVNIINSAERVNSIDFNPALQNYGHPGYPGFKLRFNWEAFRYADAIIAQMLTQQIRTVRIPSFTQCLPEVNGCAYLTNILITNYRCPQRIVSFPVSQNEIALNVQNFDLSLSGQLGGQVVVLLPLPLSGTLCIDARQISISLQIAVGRNPYNGATYLQMTKCSLTIGYLNLYIVNGGLIGEVINNNFRGKILSKVYETLPQKFCNMIPSILNEHVNSRLTNLPQSIPITQFLSYVSNLAKKPKKLPEYCYSDTCKHYHSFNTTLTSKKFKTKTILTAGVTNVASLPQKIIASNKPLLKRKSSNNKVLPENVKLRNRSDQQSFTPSKVNAKFPQKMQKSWRNEKLQRIKRNASSVNWQQCSNCDYEKSEIIPYYYETIINHIQTCASDLILSAYYLGSSATKYDFTLNFLGEFTSNSHGGVPFAPPEIQFPLGRSGRMFDLLISDYTLNTLLYHFHRRGVFAFRLGPEIPVVGDLLNFTCAAEDVDFDLSVEMEENKNDNGANETTTLNHAKSRKNRTKRQNTMDTLLNFGICLGDLTPALREKYRGKRAYIIIKTNRAPSIQFLAANGGTATIEFIIDGLIFLDGTTTQVGHIQISASVALTIKLIGNQIIPKVKFEYINVVDVDKTLGLPEEAFANLSDLARGVLTRAINKKLASAIPLVPPQLGTPVQLHNIHLQIIEHALSISADATISSSVYSPPSQRYSACCCYK